MLPHKNEFCKWLSMWNWSARIPLRKYRTKIAAEKSRNSHLRNPQIGLFRCLCGIMSFNSTRAFKRRKNCERRQGRWSNGRRCRLGCRQKPSWPFFSTAAMTINEQPIMYQHTVVDLKINTTRTTWFFNLVTAPFTSLRLAKKKYFFFLFPLLCPVMDEPFVSLRAASKPCVGQCHSNLCFVIGAYRAR